MKTTEEAKAIVEAKMRELSLARDGTVTAMAEAVSMLSERSIELEEFPLVVGRACTYGW